MGDSSIDDVLVRRAAAGDDEALGTCLRAMEGDLRRRVSIRPLWRRDLTVDDILQVSYLEAFLRVGALRDQTPGGLAAWMRRLVDSNLKDAIRGLERDKRPDPRHRVTHDGEGASARTLFARVGGLGASASEALSTDEQVGRLRSALARLPESYRQVVQEVDLGERPVAEVAVEMGRSPGAVHLLVKRAHVRLRELLGSRP